MATAITLELPDDVFATAEDAVSLGLAASPGAFIEEAVRLRAREVRHAQMRRLAEEAMADPDFVADLRETIREFRHADHENWPEPMEE